MPKMPRLPTVSGWGPEVVLTPKQQGIIKDDKVNAKRSLGATLSLLGMSGCAQKVWKWFPKRNAYSGFLESRDLFYDSERSKTVGLCRMHHFTETGTAFHDQSTLLKWDSSIGRETRKKILRDFITTSMTKHGGANSFGVVVFYSCEPLNDLGATLNGELLGVDPNSDALAFRLDGWDDAMAAAQGVPAAAAGMEYNGAAPMHADDSRPSPMDAELDAAVAAADALLRYPDFAYLPPTYE